MKWPVKKLGNFIEIVMGQAPHSDQCNKEGEGVVFVKAGEFGIESPVIKEWTTDPLKMAKADDTLICVVGATAGKINRSRFECAIGRSVAAVRTRANEVEQNYLHAFLSTKVIELRNRSQGAAQAVITREMLQDIEIPLPPLAEQQRIATLLDISDRILKQRESAIAKLDQLASTTFDEMYDELDSVSTKSLGEILELQRGASPRPISDWMTEELDGVNWIKIADATASDKYIYKCKERIKKEAVAMTRYVKSGDFLLSNSMSFGRPYILKTDGCIHDGWLLIRDTKNVFEQDFLYAVLSCKTVKEQFKKLATGAVVKNLNIDAVSKVKVKIPEKKIQKIFSEKMYELEANKTTHLKQLTIIKNLLSSLQHQSFAVN